MNRIHVILIVLTLSFFAACENFMDIHQEWIKDGEMIYSPKIDSLSFIAGRERLEFRHWLYKSPNVRTVTLYWNSGADSLIIPVKPSAGLDSVFVIVPNLQERSYTFNVRTTDMFGHKSLVKTGFGTAYGADYENSLNDRNIDKFDLKVNEVTCTKDYVFETGTVRVSWICERNVTGISATLLAAGTGMVRTEYSYTTKYGNDTTVIARASANSVELRNAILSTEAVPSYLYSRSAYIPEPEAIDTFFTAYKKEDWKQHTFPLPPKPDQEPDAPDPPVAFTFGPYDRSGWEVLEASDEREDDGGGMQMILNNNHDRFWHSQWGPDAPLPHWAIIDMKEAKNVSKFVVYRRPGWSDTKTVELYMSDSPDPNGSWKKVGEGIFPGSGNNPLVIIANDIVTKRRYLKMILPDSYRDPYTSISELIVYPSSLGRYDRSNWEVLEVSDEREDDGGGMHTLIDDNLGSYWHSMWGPDAPLPHWAIIDMKEEHEIGKIDIFRRRDNTDTRTVEIYLSNDPDPNHWSWNKIGEGTFPNTNQDLIEISTNSTVKGRYMKLFLPNSWAWGGWAPFTSVAEIYPYGYGYGGK